MTTGLPLFDSPYRDGLPGAKREGTSRDAALAIAPRAPNIRQQVYDAFQHYGPMTADECAARLNISILTVRPRVSELRTKGLLFETGQRRPNASGVQAEVLSA